LPTEWLALPNDRFSGSLDSLLRFPQSGNGH
jgi:hypothetical protein